MKLLNNTSFLLLVLVLGLSSCKKKVQNIENILVGTIKTELNPFGKVPLGARLSFTTKKKCSVDIYIEGEIPVSRTFANFGYDHNIPVIGLYSDTINSIRLTLTEEDGTIYKDELSITTAPLPDFFPSIDIVEKKKDRMEPGFHMVEQLIANNGKFLTYTIMFDDNGEIRWYMDMSSTGQITYSSYRLKNGNWLYLSWIDIFEVTDLGEVVRNEKMWGYAGDHEVMELENGNLLMGGTKKDAKIVREKGVFDSRFDFVVEWDSKINRGVKEWDLRKVLDVDRTVYLPDYSLDFDSDWFHLNSIAHSKKDNCLVVSGRNQGVLKIDENNKLKWILAPHKNWERAGYDGRGEDLNKYLLTAIDNTGNPYPKAVQEGNAGTETFEWATGQHGLSVLENGNILMFDNGLMRNFKTDRTYLRAVEYKIDEVNMTIEQMWEYGKAEGLDMYSAITSDVDPLPVTGNRLIIAGNVRAGTLPPHASIIEVTYPNSEKIFEANVYFKDELGTKEQTWAQFDLVYRGERYPLVPKAR